MVRRNPLTDLERFLEDVQGRFESATGQRIGAGPMRRRDVGVDLVEHDEEYVVTLDLPGFDREDVDVRFADRTLTVDAEASSDSVEDADEGEYVRRERRRASATERVTFPSPVRVEDVTAVLRNGVLTVTVPKADVEGAGTRVDVE